MRQPEFDRELRAIRALAHADLADRLACLVLALAAVALVILPIAHLLVGPVAHLAAALPR